MLWIYRFIILFLVAFSSISVGCDEIPYKLYHTLKELHCPPTFYILVVNVNHQTLSLYRQGKVIAKYKVSTAKNGVGQKEGSGQTPLGLHRMVSKIGEGAPPYTIFESRLDTGVIWHPDSKRKDDPVLTRIFLLQGLQEGYNSGRDADGTLVDSFERYIYIHGTHREDLLGTPASHGCVRMSNRDIIALFDRIPEGTLVWIE